MDLDLTEFQAMLVESAREFLSAECTSAVVREAVDNGQGYSAALWKKVGGLGWPGLVVSEEFGGSGGGVFDALLLAEECGRFLAPLPFVSSALISARLIESLGTAAQKAAWLPDLASGRTIWTLALTEPSARFDAEGIELRARREGGAWRLDGTKLFVRDGAIAGRLIVAARTGDAPSGITLFVVDGAAQGLTRTAQPTIGADRQAGIRFESVRVGAEEVLGVVDGAWPAIEDAVRCGTLAECAILAGVADALTAKTVAWARERHQFGRAIGSFQAVAHMCADMRTAADAIRLSTWMAASAFVHSRAGEREIAQAKAFASERVMTVARDAHQIHAGIAFIKDHDLRFWYDRAKSGELYWGDAEHHREKAAALLLDRTS